MENNIAFETVPSPKKYRGAFSQYIEPGRAFIAAYKKLSSGDKSGLRRENPNTQQAFWRCVQAARKAVAPGQIDEKYMLQMEYRLAEMTILLNLKEDRFDNSDCDIGALLRSPAISLKRKEAILSESDLVTLVESLESAMRLTKEKIDFGVLLSNLVDFKVSPGDARRRWARSLFLNDRAD